MFLTTGYQRLSSLAFSSPLPWRPSSSISRFFSHGPHVCPNESDPFGFARSNSGESLKFRQPSPPAIKPAPPSIEAQSVQKAKTLGSVADRSSPPLGSAIFRRMAQSRQTQLHDLQRFDDRLRIDREEKATPDQLWTSASQLKVQSHSGPLTPASSRVVRTVRVPPTSFLNRPAMAADVERAYKKLQLLLNTAGIKKEIYLNRRYEKPFLKRRRLRSERHRRRFAIEVQRRVQIINVMRMKGM